MMPRKGLSALAVGGMIKLWGRLIIKKEAENKTPKALGWLD
jgi:hypothetical protein